MKKNILKVLGIALLGIFLASCGNGASNNSSGNGGENNQGQQAKKEKLVVGTDGSYAPFTFKDENDKLTGFDVEVAQAVGDKLGVEVEFVVSPWDSIFLGLESKKYDMIANEISKTPEREEKYIFSDEYLISKAQLIVKPGRTDIQSLEDLKGKKVIATIGNNYTKILEDFDVNKEINIVYLETANDALLEIENGKADSTLTSGLTAGYYNKQRGNVVEAIGNAVQEEKAYLLFRKDSEDLKNRVNKALAELKADGTLTKISEKWFGADFTK